MKKVKINYNDTFGTMHSRDYYRGASFHFSGKWVPGAHYISDDYNIDFVVHGQVLLACAKSHLSTLENEPTEFITDESGTAIGVISIYWDFVLSGIVGDSPGIKIIDNYWYICKNTGVSEEEQVWENTGVKAKMELNDLSPEEIALLQEPGKQVVTEFVNNTITQETGQNIDKIMSQKAVTDALNTKATVSQVTSAITNEVQRADLTYQPKGDYATITRVATIENKIPSEASPSNQLADKAFVKDLVSTNSATFRGTYDTLAELQQQDADTNDYGFVRDSDSAGNSIFKRYKYNGSTWVFEYDITNIRFTQAQQNAIDSGITSNLVDKLNVLPNNTVLTNSIADAKKAGTDAQSDIDTHAARTDNPHNVTKVQVGLGNVNNTSDADKPISTATQLALDGKVDKVAGKQLSTEDYTAEEKQKLAGIASGAEVNVLEGVQVSGVDLTITNKKVNVNLTPITNVIPAQASSSNQLADKEFVNSSISTNTAEFKGTFNSLQELEAVTTADANDYGFVISTDAAGNTIYKRYKYVDGDWVFEYNLNNSSFTAAQWAAIQSGVTTSLVDKLNGIEAGAQKNAANTVVDADYVHTDNNYTTTEKDKLSGIAASAQVNVLEGVQVNGTDLTITDKKVNVTVPTKTSQLANDDNVVKDASYVHTDNNYTSTEKSKLSDIETGAQVNKIEQIQINGTAQTINNKTVNLPAYPTTLPASDVYSWAKAATKPSYNFSEIGGTVADSQLPDTISSDITGTAMGLKTEKLTGQEFVYRATPNTIKAKSFTLDRIYGKTLAWNQLASNTFASERTATITAGSAYGRSAFAITFQSIPAGHAAIIRGQVKSGSSRNGGWRWYFNGGTEVGGNGIFTPSAISGNYQTFTLLLTGSTVALTSAIFINNTATEDDTLYCKNVEVFDLTLLYGSEIDSMTDAQILAKFESEFPGYHDFGNKLISNDAESFETVGFNQWDEEWESGVYSNGIKIASPDRIRCKNPIPCFPSTMYKITVVGEKSNTTFEFYFLDDNGNLISKLQVTNDTFETPGNCHYFVFYTLTSFYGTTYNHDICINLSDSNFNGQYEPYRKSTLPINLDDFWVKDSQDNLVHITGGLKSADSVRDEIVGNKYIKRVGSVDLGNDLEWAKQESETRGVVFRANLLDAKSTGCGICDKYIITTQVNDITISADKIGVIAPLFTSNIQINIKDSAYSDAATFKTAMAGVYLYYELATPIEYELIEPLVPTMKVGITEARISPNTDGLSAPFCADMTYSVADYIEYADRAGALVKGASVDLTDIAASGELSGNAFKVIAEHIAKLTARVEVLEAGVGTVDTLTSTSVDSANGYYINGDKTVIIGSGAPTMVPAFAGQFYINTSGPALYYAVNNSATTDWKQA